MRMVLGGLFVGGMLALVLAGCGSRNSESTTTTTTTTSTSTSTPTPTNGGGGGLTVLTYNLNFSGHGVDQAIEAIRGSGADLVFLQETTPSWERAIRKGLSGDYPHMAFKHCCRAGGLGFLSRTPFEAKDYLDSPTGWFPAWRIIAETPLGTVQALNLHLHPPVTEGGSWVLGWFTTGDERLSEVESYRPHLDPGLPTLVAGDMNEDAKGPAVGYLIDQGFTSSLPEAHVDDATWHWHTDELGELSWQLDHILHDDRLALRSAHVIQAGESDHFPVVATFVPAK